MPSDSRVDGNGGAPTAAHGRPQPCVLDGKELVRIELEGRTVLVQAKCPHRGASMAEAYVTGEFLVCIRHGATFDLRTGRLLRGPQCADIALSVIDNAAAPE